MTLAEEWKEEGRQAALQETLLLMLRQKFGKAVDASVEQRIAAASAEQLGRWVARMVVGAETLADVFSAA